MSGEDVDTDRKCGREPDGGTTVLRPKVVDEISRSALRERLIATYDPPGELDPHELVADYDAHAEYVARNPNAGSYAVASAIDAPRGRVRMWIDNGSMPDAARGLYTADRHGWLEPDGETHLALTRLVAGVFAGGSVSSENYSPMFSDDGATVIANALRGVGAGVNGVEREHPEKGDELRAARNATILGRLLVARGAPVGVKATVESVPPYLFSDDQGTAADGFLDTYVRLRGVEAEPGGNVHIFEQGRTDAYLDSLHRLFDDRLPAPVTRAANGVRMPIATLSSACWLQEAVAALRERNG